MSSFDPEQHRAQAAPSSPSVRCDGCGAPTTPDPVREFRTVGGTVYHACSDVCLGHIDDAVSSGRPLAAPTDALPWVVHTGAVATTAWCVSFEDAVRFATQAGPGARIEGPWKELLTLRPEVALTEAARTVQDALLAAVGRGDMPAVIALTHALTALTPPRGNS